MDLLVFNNSQGAHICEMWQCPQCHTVLELYNCSNIRTSIIELGRHHSKMQPELSVKIAKTSRDHGIGMVEKVIGFLRGNLRHTHKKVRVAIHNIAVR